MHSEDRLADALQSTMPSVDADAVFARVASRKTRRRRMRAARVPAVLALIAAVAVGVGSLVPREQGEEIVARNEQGRSATADRPASDRAPSAPSGARAATPPPPAAAPDGRATDKPAPARKSGEPEIAAPARQDPGAVYEGVARVSQPRAVTAVDFVDPHHGWALGSAANGEGIHATSDGGKTWSRQATSYTGSFNAIEFVDPTTGWAVGPYAVIHTHDGGLTWVEQQTPLADPDAEDASRFHVYNDAAFLDAGRGWIVGDCGVVIATIDGGATWTTLVPRDCAKPALRQVLFTDAERGWAIPAGNEPLLATSDGGRTWSAQRLVDPELRDVFFLDPQHGWAVGRGTIFATSDGGATWTRQTTPQKVSLNGVVFADALNGWTVGGDDDEPGSGAVFATTDGGRTWVEQEIESDALRGVSAITPTLAWTFGDSGLRHTTDGGATWTAA